MGGDWTPKALTLASIRPLDEITNTRTERPIETIASRSVFTNRQTPIEKIARATLSHGGERGAVNLEVFHEWRSDVLEQIVLPSGVFGVANAGEPRLGPDRVGVAQPIAGRAWRPC